MQVRFATKDLKSHWGYSGADRRFPLENDFNYSQNRNKVVELAPNYTSFVYGDPGFSMAYMMQIKEGGSLGDIYGNTFARDEQGKIKVSDEGKPISESGNKTYLGIVIRTFC